MRGIHWLHFRLIPLTGGAWLSSKFQLNPLNPGQFYEFRNFINISPFYSKLMAKNTSFLTQNTAFEHKFHVDTRKLQKWQHGGQIPLRVAKKTTLFGQKQQYLEGNIEQTV
jgi:hypothetical protein